MGSRASLTRGLLAAIVLAVVAAASAWPLYNLINMYYVMHRNDIVVRVYRDSATSLIPISNASLTVTVFYPSPVNGSTVFQVVYNGSYQSTFYVNPKALIDWALGWLKRYGPKAYLWLEPSIIFGVAYPVSNGSDPYVVTQLFAEPFNLSYPLQGKGASFNLVIAHPIIMQLGAGALRNYVQYVNYTAPVKVGLGPARPWQEGTTTTTVTNASVTETSGPYPGAVCTAVYSNTTLYYMALYFIVPKVEYWYPNPSGVAPIALATLVASYNGSAAGDSRVSVAAYLQSQSESGASLDVDISEVPAGSLAEALQDLGYGVSVAWGALSVNVPGPSLQINLYSSSSSLEESIGGSAFSNPTGIEGNIYQIYVMGQVAFVNWTLLIEERYSPCENVKSQGFGPVLTELVVEESGGAMLPAVYYFSANDTCTNIQYWSMGQENYGAYEAWISYVCPYPGLPAPVNWTYVNYSMRYLGTALPNNGGPGWSWSYLSATGSGSDFGMSVDVGLLLGYLADFLGVPVPPQLAAVMLPVNVGLQFTNYNDVLQLEMFFAYAEVSGLEVYVTGNLNTSYFGYTTSSGSTIHLPVAFIYGTVLKARP